MNKPNIIPMSDDPDEIRKMFLEWGIYALQKRAGYVPPKTDVTWEDTQKIIDTLPTDHILALSYEDSTFVQELLFSGNYGTLTGIIDKDRV